MVIGRGSNVLVADDGFDGVAIALGESFSAIDVRGDRVVAGAGAALPVVARRTAAAALSGFEWAVGVPGSIGGAVVMNAGGHGSDMAASLLAEVRDLRRTRPSAWVPAAELRLGYRSSALHASQVVLRAELQLRRGDPPPPRRSSPTSSPGGAPTSPGEPTPARCSPTRPAIPPAGSSTRPAARACATAVPPCPPNTPTSSRSTRAAAPTTCSPSWARSVPACSPRAGRCCILRPASSGSPPRTSAGSGAI